MCFFGPVFGSAESFWFFFDISTHQLIVSTHQLIDQTIDQSITDQSINLTAHRHTYPSTHLPNNLSIEIPTRLQMDKSDDSYARKPRRSILRSRGCRTGTTRSPTRLHTVGPLSAPFPHLHRLFVGHACLAWGELGCPAPRHQPEEPSWAPP